MFHLYTCSTTTIQSQSINCCQTLPMNFLHLKPMYFWEAVLHSLLIYRLFLGVCWLFISLLVRYFVVKVTSYIRNVQMCYVSKDLSAFIAHSSLSTQSIVDGRNSLHERIWLTRKISVTEMSVSDTGFQELLANNAHVHIQ